MVNLPRRTIFIEDIEIGMNRCIQKVVTSKDIEMFAQLSTDHNPLHLDDAYAKDTIFAGQIAHGMLPAGLISAIIGEQLPCHGIIYMGQTLKFLAPVRPGEMVWAEVTVTDMDFAKRRVKLRSSVVGKKVLMGPGIVKTFMTITACTKAEE